MLRLFWHIVRINENQLAKEIIERRINGAKGRGRQRKSWLSGTVIREKKGQVTNLKYISDIWM